MSLVKPFLALVFTSIALFSYVDNDLDGVDDKDDLCPNTSFSELVDENGCPENNTHSINNLGSLTLQLNNSWQFDTNNTFDNYGFSLYYAYDDWSFSLSNAQQTTLDNNNQTSQSRGDLYVDMGYNFKHEKLQSRVTMGTKIAIANENIGTGEDDYYTALSLNYLAHDNLALFSNFTYTFVGDTPTINYQDSFAYGLGIAYLPTEHWYSSLSFNQADSIYTNGIPYQSLSWYNSYTIKRDYFIGVNYNYGLDELSFDHSLTLSLGATFE